VNFVINEIELLKFEGFY